MSTPSPLDEELAPERLTAALRAAGAFDGGRVVEATVESSRMTLLSRSSGCACATMAMRDPTRFFARSRDTTWRRISPASCARRSTSTRASPPRRRPEWRRAATASAGRIPGRARSCSKTSPTPTRSSASGRCLRRAPSASASWTSTRRGMRTGGATRVSACRSGHGSTPAERSTATTPSSPSGSPRSATGSATACRPSAASSTSG